MSDKMQVHDANISVESGEVIVAGTKIKFRKHMANSRTYQDQDSASLEGNLQGSREAIGFVFPAFKIASDIK